MKALRRGREEGERGPLPGPTEPARQEGSELTVEALAVLVVAMRRVRPLLDEAHDQPEREAGERTRKGERASEGGWGRALALRRCRCSRCRGESWQLWTVESRGRQGDGRRSEARSSSSSSPRSLSSTTRPRWHCAPEPAHGTARPRARTSSRKPPSRRRPQPRARAAASTVAGGALGQSLCASVPSTQCCELTIDPRTQPRGVLAVLSLAPPLPSLVLISSCASPASAHSPSRSPARPPADPAQAPPLVHRPRRPVPLDLAPARPDLAQRPRLGHPRRRHRRLAPLPLNLVRAHVRERPRLLHGPSLSPLLSSLAGPSRSPSFSSSPAAGVGAACVPALSPLLRFVHTI